MAEFTSGGKYGNDTFIINDVQFRVSPTAIRINKQTHNFRYDVVRSNTPHHIRSGHGMAQINLEIELVGLADIRAMQRLIAEVELTPFVYLENEHIRINMVGTLQDASNMAGCVKSIAISTSEGDREHLSATVIMDWFNYKPYSSSFSFASTFTDQPVQRPAESELWQMWVSGVFKNRYQNYPSTRPLNDLVFSSVDYLLAPQEGKKKNEATRRREKLKESIAIYEDELGARKEQKSKHKLSKEEQQGLDSAIAEIDEKEKRLLLGTDNADAIRAAANNVREVVRKTAHGKIRDFNEVVNAMKAGGWKLLDGESLQSIQRLRAEMSIAENFNLFWKPDILVFNVPEYIISNITYNLRNQYVHLPIIGHQYSTIQHLGGIDKQITISMIVDGEVALGRLQGFWDRLQKNVLKMRTLTKNQTIAVENDILNAFGVELLIPESLNHSTIKGNPGQYAVSLVFSAGTYEQVGELSQEIPIETEKSIYKEFLGMIDKYFVFERVERVSTMRSSKEGIEKTTGKKVLIWTIRKQYKGLLDNKNNAATEEAIMVRIINDVLLPALNENTLARVVSGMGTVELQGFLAKGGEIAAAIYQRLAGSTVGSIVATAAGTSLGALNSAIRPALTFIEILDLIIKYESELNKNTIVGPYITRPAKYIKNITKKPKAQTAGETQDSGEKKDVQDGNKYSKEQWTVIERYFNNIITDIEAELFLILRKILLETLGRFESFKGLADKAKKIGLIHGNTCYPDMNLKPIEEALMLEKGQYVNPDFYFYKEGISGWDGTVFESMIGKAQELIENQEDFMLNGGFPNWVQHSYLESLTQEQKAVHEYRVKNLTTNVKKRFVESNTKEAKAAGEKITDVSPAAHIGIHEQGSIISNASQSAKNQNPSRPGTTKDTSRIWSNSSHQTDFDPKKKKVFATLNNIIHGYSADFITKGVASSPHKSGRSVPREKFCHPMGTIGIRTSGWGEHRVNENGNKYQHEGIDWSSGVLDLSGGVNAPIYAIADGKVSSINKNFTKQSYSLTILHPDIGLKTVYLHVDPTTLKVISGQKVTRKDELGKIFPNADSRSKSRWKPTRGHLHFECHVLDAVKLTQALGENIPLSGDVIGKDFGKPWNIDPEFILNKSTGRRANLDQGFRLGKGLLSESLKSLQESLIKNNIYRMGRAFPTFKLYFIEEDTIDGEGRRALQFDDLFGYSALYDLTVHRSEDNAVDTAVVTLSNVSGNLSNRRFGHDMLNAYDAQGKKVSEDAKKFGEKENPIASFMMQEGLKVQLKLGYEANPNNLEEVITGTVSGVEFNESTDIVTITIDGYGYELVQMIKGAVQPNEKTSGYLIKDAAETQEILSDLLAESEVKHFGRWEPGRSNATRAALTDRWKWVAEPSDDNIFAPDSTSLDGGGGIIFEHLRYFIHRTTIWDVFKEMEYRHPECIAQAVPYAGNTGPRMTMFFGSPSQMYFSKDLRIDQESEIRIAGEAQKKAKIEEEEAKRIQKKKHVKPEGNLIGNLKSVGQAKAGTSGTEITVDISDFLLQKGIQAGQIKPFRNYHLATSWTNIVSNSIKATADNVYNSVIVNYDEVDGWSEETQQWTFESHLWDSGQVEMKAHWTIPEELTRELRLSGEQVLNCETEDLAQRYALKALKEGLRNIYKGELIILGNAKVKPNDIVYIVDAYSDMVGPIEVSSVTHHLSKDTGFVSIIKPKMCVSINEWASMSITDALGYMLQHALGFGLGDTSLTGIKAAADVGMAAAGLTLAAGGAPITAFTIAAGYGLFTLGGKKIIQMSQYGNPIILSPLVVHGKPLTAGIGHRYTKNGFWIHRAGQTVKWAHDAEEGLRGTYGDFMDAVSDFWRNDKLGETGHFFGGNK